jgi:hypothetical protein
MSKDANKMKHSVLLGYSFFAVFAVVFLPCCIAAGQDGASFRVTVHGLPSADDVEIDLIDDVREMAVAVIVKPIGHWKGCESIDCADPSGRTACPEPRAQVEAA